MNEHLQKSLEYARKNEETFVENLAELIRIPSISTKNDNSAEMTRAANWVKDKLTAIGMKNAQVMPTDLHPVVYAESLDCPGQPTVLVYGHYDVQPDEPLGLWETPPFEPTRIGELMVGRGTSDMKGQVVATLSAIESITRTGKLPINLKFLFEGEEEIGSPSIEKWMKANKDLLIADFCLNPDAGMLGEDIPTLTKGLRGIAYYELWVHGPDHDLHSGMAGGAVHNPGQAMAELIAKMHNSDGSIALPGFYDDVFVMTEQDRKEFAALPHSDEDYKKLFGVSELWGEENFIVAERLGARPTLEVNGILSGFTGAGQKTVLPSWAMAKISCRLVPNQDPTKVTEQFMKFLSAHVPSTVHWELKQLSGAKASVIENDQPGLAQMAAALESVWGKKPLYPREGGSIPIVGYFQQILGLGSVLTGFGLPGDNLHAPNEHLHLPTFHKGIQALIHFFFNF